MHLWRKLLSPSLSAHAQASDNALSRHAIAVLAVPGGRQHQQGGGGGGCPLPSSISASGIAKSARQSYGFSFSGSRARARPKEREKGSVYRTAEASGLLVKHL
jgi:hypothetical protein